MSLGSGELRDALARISAGARPADIESDHLDFKTQAESKPAAISALVEAAVCFANAGGGTLVMGVANGATGRAAFTGCDLEPSTVQRRIHELTEPALMVGARAEEYSGVVLLVVDVLQSFEVHADKQGRATRRLGTDEAAGLSRSEAVRRALIESAGGLRRRAVLKAEAAALEADDDDRREMLEVAALMEGLRAPG